ncbi:MAG: preprotein translocase subunit SecY [Sphaerochaetaceae bacterium]|nr:preprotein translocase subunit SecY [Sphaerochaetaceae bacterium]MDD3162861.1 preprotein translocase subunit SecY [Sphaerochaetaceae bacterium]MDD4006452.1 preprotein translocase subunit SecY [Sphaerochaetaceae bacterium]
MSNALVDMFRIKELRKKIFITLLLLAISRIGTVIPIPGIDPNVLEQYFLAESSSKTIGITEYLNFFSGGAFSNFSLFMLGVMPYISMQIILQLLMLIIPSLKRLGQDANGRRKIQSYTRYGTIVICLIESYVVTFYAKSIPGALTIGIVPFTLIALLTVTTGTMFLVWLGEKITQLGIGNGISLLIFAGIVARIPSALTILISGINAGTYNPVLVVILFIMFIVVVALVVCEQEGQRKIPVDYAKRVVGRKMYGAQSTYIPFKINPSGVIPVIFASALLSFPLQIASSLGPNVKWLNSFANWLNPQGAPYLIIYTLLIIAFAFFYTQVTLNPQEMAKNIRENGGTVRGVRPGKDAKGRDFLEVYLSKVLNRIVFPGSLFLAFIALIPTLIQIIFKFPASVSMLFGGTSMMILVGVDLDTMKQIEAEMKTHHFDGIFDPKRKKKARNL